MGQIKSTLDLVMERTRNMTMSEEEKRETRLAEFRRKLGGLVERYRTRLIKMSEFERELAEIQKEGGVNDPSAVRAGIAGALSLDRDNTAVFELLRERCGINPAPLEALMEAYGADQRRAVNIRMGEMIRELEAHHGITGSAVVPNPRADGQWKERLDALRERYAEMLNGARSGLGVG